MAGISSLKDQISQLAKETSIKLPLGQIRPTKTLKKELQNQLSHSKERGNGMTTVSANNLQGISHHQVGSFTQNNFNQMNTNTVQ